ncbi:alanine racemase [Bacillus mesophilus]|uniref:Alanine racemase n=1 Tax=Bacillus mesophilus TaxID=1808955 RepID=A0A6M0QEX4_9BACI|nr:alanine racemase [Bacillus mesophilus]
MSHFYRDTWVEVSLNNIYENVSKMREYLDDSTRIIAVVKANAYGHGDLGVARVAIEAGASLLAVAFLDEALSLRRGGITEPILVLGVTRPEDAVICAEQNLSVTVFHEEWLKQVKDLQIEKPLKIHVKYDTGMNRLGTTSLDELHCIIKIIEKHPSFSLEGLFTHFATADELETDYFDQQFLRFQEAVNSVVQKTANIPIIHCGNSATGLRFPEKLFNAVRMGISMYGLSPSMEMQHLLPFELKQAFSLHSKISHVKKIKAGESVSYGATYTSEQEEWIATVPVGYADGWLRRLSNQEVLVNGKRTQIVGRICMDQFMIRLPEKMDIGTRVTLIGEQGMERISIDEVAEEMDTINYEIPCMISYRVPRIHMKNGKIEHVINPIIQNM